MRVRHANEWNYNSRAEQFAPKIETMSARAPNKLQMIKKKNMTQKQTHNIGQPTPECRELNETGVCVRAARQSMTFAFASTIQLHNELYI